MSRPPFRHDHLLNKTSMDKLQNADKNSYISLAEQITGRVSVPTESPRFLGVSTREADHPRLWRRHILFLLRKGTIAATETGSRFQSDN